jgi:hypothetical protein
MKYDIVAKLPVIQYGIENTRGQDLGNNKAVFGYIRNQVGDSSKWWFDNIHPEDSIKMSIKLYLHRTKNRNWQDECFKCADNLINILDRGFLLKRREWKAIRMIGAIKI